MAYTNELQSPSPPAPVNGTRPAAPAPAPVSLRDVKYAKVYRLTPTGPYHPPRQYYCRVEQKMLELIEGTIEQDYGRGEWEVEYYGDGLVPLEKQRFTTGGLHALDTIKRPIPEPLEDLDEPRILPSGAIRAGRLSGQHAIVEDLTRQVGLLGSRLAEAQAKAEAAGRAREDIAQRLALAESAKSAAEEALRRARSDVELEREKARIQHERDLERTAAAARAEGKAEAQNDPLYQHALKLLKSGGGKADIEQTVATAVKTAFDAAEHAKPPPPPPAPSGAAWNPEGIINALANSAEKFTIMLSKAQEERLAREREAQRPPQAPAPGAGAVPALPAPSGPAPSAPGPAASPDTGARDKKFPLPQGKVEPGYYASRRLSKMLTDGLGDQPDPRAWAMAAMREITAEGRDHMARLPKDGLGEWAVKLPGLSLLQLQADLQKPEAADARAWLERSLSILQDLCRL